jgi:hypothetical protein
MSRLQKQAAAGAGIRPAQVEPQLDQAMPFDEVEGTG